MFECKLDVGAWVSCASPKSLTGLGDGEHTFSVRATDTAGNTDTTPATRTWTVDTVAPDTSISSGPSGTVRASSAEFAFTSSEAGSSFECKLDVGAWVSCASPKSLAGLADGEHTFSVRATDPAGNVDATPATKTWVAQAPASDTSAPQLVSSSVTPTTVDVSSSGRQVTVTARVTDATGAEPPTIVLSSSTTTQSAGFGSMTMISGTATDGTYSKTVTIPQGAATGNWDVVLYPLSDTAGNSGSFQTIGHVNVTSTAASDTTAPETTITAGPSGSVKQATADFSFASSETGSSFECKLDVGAWVSCASPKSLTGLGDGEHTFSVRATDAAGNVDATPATRTWTVDTAPPPSPSPSPEPSPSPSPEPSPSPSPSPSPEPSPSPSPGPSPTQGHTPQPTLAPNSGTMPPTSVPANTLIALPGLTVSRTTPTLSVSNGRATLGRMTAEADVVVEATLLAKVPQARASAARVARSRPQVIGRLKATMNRGDSRTLSVRMSPKNRKRLRRLKRLRVTLVVKTALAASGQTNSKREALTLRVR